MEVKITDNALNVLAAKSYKGIGRAWIVKHFKGHRTDSELVALLNESIKANNPITLNDFESVKIKVSHLICQLSEYIEGVVAIGDKEFPVHRGNVNNSDQPVVLFYRGDFSLLSKSACNIAVIGLLAPDEATKEVESEVVSMLVNRGATIVSGLALGCDTIAHKQALRSEGKTVAILPSPLNEVLPASNKGLAEEIVNKNGLLVTEYYEKAKSKMELSGRYKERDRLQALFSDCVVLAASYAKNDLGLDSGSRLAMEYAEKYFIPRAVMYDTAKDSDNPKYDLNRQLISSQVEIIVISRNNIDFAVEEILRKPALQKVEAKVQADMFG